MEEKCKKKGIRQCRNDIFEQQIRTPKTFLKNLNLSHQCFKLPFNMQFLFFSHFPNPELWSHGGCCCCLRRGRMPGSASWNCAVFVRVPQPSMVRGITFAGDDPSPGREDDGRKRTR